MAGKIISPPGTRRNTALFLVHLEDLRWRLRAHRKIHVICDNAAFHKTRAVQKYLERWGHRFELHFLPTYAPEMNPIERVWWHLHETITRNHECTTIEELLREAATGPPPSSSSPSKHLSTDSPRKPRALMR